MTEGYEELLEQLEKERKEHTITATGYEAEVYALKAEVARLREALNAAVDALSTIDCTDDCVEGARCKHCTDWERAVDVLTET